MLLYLKGISKKVDSIPTLQCRVSNETYERFTEIANHYNCTRAELLRALIKYLIKSHVGA
tara:strand:+ start:137 stop:316 length:180 start_codon:yes stop_codon:yes gene_type:complete